jgi:hypothetical protein
VVYESLIYRSSRDCKPVVQCAIGERFGKVRPPNGFRPIEVGDSAGDFQHAMVAARRKPHGVGYIAEQLKTRRVGGSNGIENIAVCLRVHPQIRAGKRFETIGLNLARCRNARRDFLASLRRRE